MGSAVTEGVLEFVDDFSVAIGGESFQTQGRPGDVAAQSLELFTLVGLAGDGSVE